MCCKRFVAPALFAMLGLGAVAGTFALAESKKADPAAGQPAMKLPPGWTESDMQVCMAAGMPGKQQEVLAKDAGVWSGKSTMWMGPDTEAMTAPSTSTVTPIMDGRFVRVEVASEMPGMGPYSGLGINGFDNVAGKFVGTWIDNHGTGIMTAAGELSADGKTMTWTYNYTCPLTKKPAVMRQVETTTGPGAKVMEMFGADPKSGKEFKMMRVELTKK